MDPVTIGLITSALATSAVNAGSQIYTNKQNIAMQKKQLQYAQNAQSIAARDRMSAGLSPLDSQAQAAPSVGGAAVAPTVSDISSAIASAMDLQLRKTEINNQTNATNADVAKKQAETQEQLMKNQELVNTLQTRIDTANEELEKLRNENSSYASKLKAQLDNWNAQKNKYEAEIAEIRELLASRKANIESNTRANNAEAAEQEQENNFARALQIPPSLLKSVDARNPQAMLVYAGLMKAADDRYAANQYLSLSNDKDVQDAYRAYEEEFYKRQREIDEKIIEYNKSFHYGNPPEGFTSWQDYRSYLKGQQKGLKKILSFEDFIKQIR